jgi:3-hydroxymyristoyl/3-hydroxydecanoyl-(acyl carrier protein) dehydratase
VELTKLRGTVGKGEGRAYVGTELAAEAEFTFALESAKEAPNMEAED